MDLKDKAALITGATSGRLSASALSAPSSSAASALASCAASRGYER